MDHPDSTSSSQDERSAECACSAVERDDQLRCPCGSLLARHVAGGIELRCRRCKRSVVVPASET